MRASGLRERPSPATAKGSRTSHPYLRTLVFSIGIIGIALVAATAI
jgi:hypothetical protein